MERSRAAALRRAAPLGAALLVLLRVLILNYAFDEKGLLPRGSSVLFLSVLAAAGVFAVLGLLCRRLNRLPGREDCLSGGAAQRLLLAAAALLVFLGALLELTEGGPEPGKAELAIRWAGMLSGLLLLAVALVPQRGRGFFWARFLPALYTGAALILRFRDWSHDPLVIHVAPVLLAWTCFMVEMMLLSGFPLGAGHRRSAVLFGLAAGVFTCMTLPDYVLGDRAGLSELLSFLGLGLWCAVSAFALLRSRVQEEEPELPPAPEA